ncbi:MAG: LacI family DNA-binding transcriptional regulator [Nocardioidaceae bacterium]|nr:LacI family DNA-binding transcriptional regulator [Nocardioidaceae bacterium]
MVDTGERPRRRSAGERVGVREVARLAGVSTQTVSRVLNDSPSLREGTRQRVLAAIAELGYRPNNAARSLGTATTRTLGVIVTDATLHGPAMAIAELARAAHASGRWVSTAYADADDEASVRTAVAHILGQGVDALVLVAPHVLTRRVLESVRGDLPLVVMHEGPPDRQAEAAGVVADHLADLGHTRIGRLGGPDNWLEEAARRRGFAEALAARDLEAGPAWSGDWSAESGAAAAGAIAAAVRTPGGPTAIAVANDQMALGLIAGLELGGLRVPGDVSVAGFDDNPDTAFYRPPLTTVRIDVGGEARRCVATAFGDPEPARPAPPELVVRSSTAPPAAG